jgi:uncharacterized protein HemX
MKRIILLTVALLFVAAMGPVRIGLCEEDMDKSDVWVEKQMKKMTKKLTLTQDQVPQVEAALKEKVEKKKAAREEMQAKIDSIKEEYDAKIKALLTEEQQKIYDDMKEQNKDWKKDKKGKNN